MEDTLSASAFIGIYHSIIANFFISFQNYLSRNFYNLRFLALFIAFALNFILLFYKVCFD